VPVDHREALEAPALPDRRRGVPRAALSLLVISILTFFLGLGRQAITDSDEAFYAEAAREMVETGDWLTPHFNYEDRWQKPVLYYWLTAATYLVTGQVEGIARLWSALSGLGLALLTWHAARRITNRADTAWIAGAITATCFGYFLMARAALPDLPLTFFITLGIWAALDRRWPLAGGAAGLGFLMKGPVALVIPGLVLLPIWWRERTYRTPAARDLGVAALVFAAIGLPWYVAMWMTHGSAYLQSFFVADNFERFATDRFNEPRAFWFYLPIVIGGMVPWSAYLVALPLRSLRAVLTGTQRLAREEWRLILWASVPLAFYTISIGKQPRYILPVLPPLAILLARSIATRIESAMASDPQSSVASDFPPSPGRKSLADLRIATWITAALYVTMAVLLVRARLLFIAAYPLLTWLAVGGIIAAAFALAWVAATARWTQLPAFMAAAAVTLLLGIQFGALAGHRPEPVEQMASLVRSYRTANEPVGTYQVFVRNLIFYTQFKQVALFDEGRALEFMRSPEPVLLVVERTNLQRLQTISGVKMRLLGAVQYLNTNNIRLRTLLFPMPAQDLETVYLVTNR
jgi:4-amino-4-deoxy-L-arabinose transferase-like glycosyltransferase